MESTELAPWRFDANNTTSTNSRCSQSQNWAARIPEPQNAVVGETQPTSHYRICMGVGKIAPIISVILSKRQ